ALSHGGSPSAEEVLDLVAKLVFMDGLRHVVVAAGVAGTLLVTHHGMGGDSDDGNVAQLGMCLDAPGRLPAVHPRHPEDHEDQARARAPRVRDRIRSVHRDEHRVGVLQDLDEEVAVELLILHHEDALARAHAPARASARSRTSGSVRVKAEPLPSSLSATTCPPSSRARRRTMASPSPVPPWRRVLDMSTWRNSSKMYSSASAGMPMPV